MVSQQLLLACQVLQVLKGVGGGASGIGRIGLILRLSGKELVRDAFEQFRENGCQCSRALFNFGLKAQIMILCRATTLGAFCQVSILIARQDDIMLCQLICAPRQVIDFILSQQSSFIYVAF